ncbi:hypothetical protein V7149_00070 [Bacillus sp. JJ1503]|uniref:hypothetical protein n=1 Tax=Bacillus sp. JJ1503 TaxID=3122956 RepID=UPI002FFF7A61
MSKLLDWYNGLADKVVGAEVEFILKPVGNAIVEGAIYVTNALTDVMPEIGVGIVVVCAVGIMLTGDIPKWLARMAVGLGGAIIWLLNA